MARHGRSGSIQGQKPPAQLPTSHAPPAQQGCPLPPHVVHVSPLPHASPAPHQSPGQQGRPCRPQARQRLDSSCVNSPTQTLHRGSALRGSCRRRSRTRSRRARSVPRGSRRAHHRPCPRSTAGRRRRRPDRCRHCRSARRRYRYCRHSNSVPDRHNRRSPRARCRSRCRRERCRCRWVRRRCRRRSRPRRHRCSAGSRLRPCRRSSRMRRRCRPSCPWSRRDQGQHRYPSPCRDTCCSGKPAPWGTQGIPAYHTAHTPRRPCTPSRSSTSPPQRRTHCRHSNPSHRSSRCNTPRRCRRRTHTCR